MASDLGDLVCQSCGLVSPEGTAWCDCGHIFDMEEAESWIRQGHRPRGRNHLTGSEKLLAIGAGLATYFAVQCGSSAVVSCMGIQGLGGSIAAMLSFFVAAACGWGAWRAARAAILRRERERWELEYTALATPKPTQEPDMDNPYAPS